MRHAQNNGSRSSVRGGSQQEGDWDGRWVLSAREIVGRNEDVGDAVYTGDKAARKKKVRGRKAAEAKAVAPSGLQYERRQFDAEKARLRAAGAL